MSPALSAAISRPRSEVAAVQVIPGGDALTDFEAARLVKRLQAADAVAKVWDGYFKAIPKSPAGDDYGDQVYHTEAQQMLMTTMITPPWCRPIGK